MKKLNELEFRAPLGQGGASALSRRDPAGMPATDNPRIAPARDATGLDLGQNDGAEASAEGLLSASGLLDAVVRDVNGKRLGEVEDFILDVADGKIEYVVFSFGGLFGLGNKLCAVAPQLLKLDEDNMCFRLGYDRKRVGNAPEFDKYEWRHLPWTEHRSRIYILRGKKHHKEVKTIRSHHMYTFKR